MTKEKLFGSLFVFLLAADWMFSEKKKKKAFIYGTKEVIIAEHNRKEALFSFGPIPQVTMEFLRKLHPAK